MTLRILFVTAEYEGLIKVGGLGDVAAGLPRALLQLGHDVRILLPYYGCLNKINKRQAPIVAKLPGARGYLREYRIHKDEPIVWLLDSPAFRQRRGHPYHTDKHQAWPDDAQAFAGFSKIAAWLAGDALQLGWQADIVHANEWHAGLTPLYMMLHRVPAACIFTLHNLAYQGIFPASTLQALNLPGWLYHPEALEFYGDISFLKAGLVFADRLTTVSPNYAREILTPKFGEQLDGVLRARHSALSGILNGIDTQSWDPATDQALPANFSARQPQAKAQAKSALIEQLGLTPAQRDEALLVFVGRLSPQKGIDQLLNALPMLMDWPIRLAVLGSGDRLMETALNEAAQRYRSKLAVQLRYDETLARRYYAGADIFLMPSHFEPCGLSQMYAMRYGALPIAHAVGGLRDSIDDRRDGFLYARDTLDDFIITLQKALRIYNDKTNWQKRMRAAMDKNFAWQTQAQEYVELYQAAVRLRFNNPFTQRNHSARKDKHSDRKGQTISSQTKRCSVAKHGSAPSAT